MRTRLSFAQFKLNNGWENSSIFDVEGFWKKKQIKSINKIPTPRFTQQDIIDKRLHHVKKRSKSLSSTCVAKKLKQKTDQQTFYFYHHYDKSNDNIIKPETSPAMKNHSRSSFDDSHLTSVAENSEPTVVKNTLDYLSYAIAITEKNDNLKQNSEQSLPLLSDGDDEEDDDTELNLRTITSPDWTRTSQLRLSLSIPGSNENDQSVLPEDISSAAQAMLMFVNRPSP